MERITLRPYQEEARQAVFNEWNSDNRRTLLVLATGTGKTVIFSKIIEDCVKNGDKCLILAHRGELLEQAADKMRKLTGMGCALEKANSSCLDDENLWYPVVLGSVQTVQQPKRLERFSRDYFQTIVVDEAHHSLSEGYKRILDYFSDAKVLGVTATPDRGDRQSLGEIYQSIAYEYNLPRAIKDGYLCRIKAQTIPLELDMTQVKTQAGDYSLSSIGTALDPYLEQIATEMETYCKGRKTIVFLPLIATSQKFCGILNEHGFRAVEVNGMSEDRAEILKDFQQGKYDVICNSMLLTEGFDEPSIDCVVCLRPTKVRSLFSQIIGRGTRLFPGKDHLLLLDFLWLSQKLELCRPADLIATKADVRERMIKNAENGEVMDIEEAMEQAENDVMAEREEKLAKELEAMRKKKRALVDPLQYEMSIQDKDLSNYVPNIGWEMAPASEKQIKALEKYGIYAEAECAGKASLILDKLAKRRDAGMTTPKQIRLLERYGFVHVGEWQFATAQNMISRIALNSWRVPKNIRPQEYFPVEVNNELQT